MKFLVLLVLVFSPQCWAYHEWSIHPSCDRDTVTYAMREALGLVSNALDVLSHSGTNPRVVEMTRMILGTNLFTFNREIARGILHGIERGLSSNPSPLTPDSTEWKAQKTMWDIELHCDTSRFRQLKENIYLDTSVDIEFDTAGFDQINHCHRAPKARGIARMITTDPGYFDQTRWQLDGANQANRKSYERERPKYPNVIDICGWFRMDCFASPFKTMSVNQIAAVMHPAFANGLPTPGAQIDSLVTMGVVLLHELFHTRVGTRLEDMRDGNCYGWLCVKQLKSTQNAENMMYFCIAMKVFSLGFWLDDAGNLRQLP